MTAKVVLSNGPYRDQPIPPCAQHCLVGVYDEEGGMQVWCIDCEKLWWTGTRAAWGFYTILYEWIGEIRVRTCIDPTNASGDKTEPR